MADRSQVRYQKAQAIAHRAEISARSNTLRLQSDQLLTRSRATRTISDVIHEKFRKFFINLPAVH
jgi:hypothetical protein